LLRRQRDALRAVHGPERAGYDTMAISTHRVTLRSADHATDEHALAPRLWPHLPNITLAALRIVAGLMLMQHGVQKHFGLLLAPGQPAFGALRPFSMFWVAGTLEIGGGLLLALGLFTRPVAFVLTGFMAFAYFLGHAKNSFFPAVNGGELALLNCFVFLAFAAIGGGRYSLDHLLDQRLPSEKDRTLDRAPKGDGEVGTTRSQ
jgi:putative oxidoreductase